MLQTFQNSSQLQNLQNNKAPPNNPKQTIDLNTNLQDNRTNKFEINATTIEKTPAPEDRIVKKQIESYRGLLEKEILR